jgi:predicted kinase
MNKGSGRPPVLYIFSGLPGAGKSTLAQELSRSFAAIYLRIDTIEQTLKDLGMTQVEEEGYVISHRIAAENLRLGLSVVADSCNPLEITRRDCEKVAADSGAGYVNIEVVCSNKSEHRRRVETRPSTVPGLKLPAWADVETREYQPWNRQRILLETAGRSEKECLDELRRSLPLE